MIKYKYLTFTLFLIMLLTVIPVIGLAAEDYLLVLLQGDVLIPPWAIPLLVVIVVVIIVFLIVKSKKKKGKEVDSSGTLSLDDY